MTPGFHSDIPEATYHADRGSLSHSGVKALLKAPAIFKWEQDHPVHRDVYDFGTAAHALVLGRGMESVYVAPYDDWTKRKGPEGGVKYTTDEKRIAQEDGLSPILPEQWLTVCDMADALSKHSLAMELLKVGEPEVSAYAIDPPTGVLRRCRFDFIGERVGVDYKSHPTGNPDTFARDAHKFGYYIQHPYYLDIARDLGHPMEAFCFIVQAKEPPYLVTVVELDEAAVDLGRIRYREALERFRDCTEAGVWPGYITDDQIARVSLPRWAYYDQEVETA